MTYKSITTFLWILSWLCTASASNNPTEIARKCGWDKTDEIQLDGPIEAATAFRSEHGSEAYFVVRSPTERLVLARWDEAAGITWQRDLEFPIFVSLSSSMNGELVAACAWEEESVLGFVFDRSGAQRFRESLDPMSQLTILPDGRSWSVTWAMFDWPAAESSEAPSLSFLPECSEGKWNKRQFSSTPTVWWYRPVHHPSETPHPALCYPAFALTDSNGTLLFSEQETGSFVTFFADVVCGDDRLLLVKEGEDAVGDQAREMIALTESGQELWRIRAHRQSSQVSGFLRGQDLILVFTGEDIEYRNATNGDLIASDTLKLEQRERLFPIQGFLHSDEDFIILGRQLSVRVHLEPGKAITDCEPLEMGGALSFDGTLCVLYSTASDSAAKSCVLFRRAE